MSDFIHAENAVVADNSIRNEYTVNYELVNTKEYHDKFNGLTGHKAVDEALYQKAVEILARRNGTPYEDIAMLDKRTGELLVENTSASGLQTHTTGLTEQQATKLNATGKMFEILHNHPASSMPSTDDIKWLYKRLFATASTVICHNGNIYRMVKLKPIDDIESMIEAIYTKIKEIYPDWTKQRIEYVAVRKILKNLQRSQHILYMER